MTYLAEKKITEVPLIDDDVLETELFVNYFNTLKRMPDTAYQKNKINILAEVKTEEPVHSIRIPINLESFPNYIWVYRCTFDPSDENLVRTVMSINVPGKTETDKYTRISESATGVTQRYGDMVLITSCHKSLGGECYIATIKNNHRVINGPYYHNPLEGEPRWFIDIMALPDENALLPIGTEVKVLYR